MNESFAGEAAAEAEAVHAANHLRAQKAIKSTKENLREAITGETHEFKEMYPEMIAAAKEEGAKDAEKCPVWRRQGKPFKKIE